MVGFASLHLCLFCFIALVYVLLHCTCVHFSSLHLCTFCFIALVYVLLYCTCVHFASLHLCMFCFIALVYVLLYCTCVCFASLHLCMFCFIALGNQCIVNFNWPMSCARAFLRNNWLPHFRLLLSSPSPSIQNMMKRAMIRPHFKIDEKWILTFLYIYRWNIDLKEKNDN